MSNVSNEPKIEKKELKKAVAFLAFQAYFVLICIFKIILSNKKWGLNQNTLGNLYKSLVGSILDYSFPCLNSFSENNIKKLQAIQNTAVRSILKLKYDTPSNIVHHEAFNKLKLLTVSNRLFEFSERYVGTGLSHSIPLVERLVKEYKEGFESRYIEYLTLLCNFYLTISSYFPET
ncbi:hypothetical protein BpHYR1_035859 [Brachionus plicatilis]|uniref:RNA-directed DNA polymerase from mobile element jockey-like n=1 Tax=Brachionus plicatilis TaxID=10195 RepID=A0A3M7S572_BRAPC|nr:hypothetical protein BpHYR1_035859 [Brachionus plicatilis]